MSGLFYQNAKKTTHWWENGKKTYGYLRLPHCGNSLNSGNTIH